MWDGIIAFIEVGILGLLFLTTLLTPRHFNPLTYMVVCCGLVPIMLVQFAWVIVGCVSIWRDNLSCGPDQLKIMMWAACIIHLVCMGIK
jgi:hypothetical protein